MNDQQIVIRLFEFMIDYLCLKHHVVNIRFTLKDYPVNIMKYTTSQNGIKRDEDQKVFQFLKHLINKNSNRKDSRITITSFNC
jgi:hypothetical protein